MIEYTGLDGKIHNTEETNCFYCGLPLTSDDFKNDKIVEGVFHTKCYDNYVIGKESEEDYKISERERHYGTSGE